MHTKNHVPVLLSNKNGKREEKMIVKSLVETVVSRMERPVQWMLCSPFWAIGTILNWQNECPTLGHWKKSTIAGVRARNHRLHYIPHICVWLSALLICISTMITTLMARYLISSNSSSVVCSSKNMADRPLLLTLVYTLYKRTTPTIYQFKRLSNTAHITQSFLSQTQSK